MPGQKSSLQAVLDRQAAHVPPPQPARPARTHRREPAPVDEGPRESATRPSREGKRLIAGHFDPKVAKHLRILAAEEDTSIQALLEEALDLLFVKKGRGPIVRG
jgi:hypothetical protein